MKSSILQAAYLTVIFMPDRFPAHRNGGAIASIYQLLITVTLDTFYR